MFILPELRHDYGSYEPYIDTETMKIHHTKHHAGYVDKLNQALAEADIETGRVEDLFEKISELPVAIRNNAGGHYNHSVFWSLLTKNVTVPSPDLLEAIKQSFGSLDDFKMMFTKEALGVFGSGWVWFVLNNAGELKIVTTGRQDNPVMNDINAGYPILGLDLWEHAYYLHYQNRRNEYIENFWNVINWEEVSRRFSEQPEMAQI